MAEDVGLVEVAVRRYKNLSDVRVEWADRLLLYGANGVGKTNLLEVLTLAFGSRASLWQLASRAAAPDSAEISAVVASTFHELPLAPAMCALDRDDLGARERIGNPIIDSHRFWKALDVSSGETWDEAWFSVGDSRLCGLLQDSAHRPFVRYHLDSLSGLSAAQGVDRGLAMRSDDEPDPDEVKFVRRYSRTLAIEGPPPGWLAELAPKLPTGFAPLRRFLDEPPETRSRYVDLVELPPTDWAPVRVVWLSSERTGDEAFYDLWDAYSRSVPAVVALGHGLDRLLLRDRVGIAEDEEPDHGDARFWLAASAARTADQLLRVVAPALRVFADSEFPGDLVVEGERGRATQRLADHRLFQALSSGQRAWLDIGLAQAAADLERLHVDASWLERGIASLSDDDLLRTGSELEGRVSTEVTAEGYWPADDVDRAVSFMRRTFGDALNVIVGSNELEPGQQQLMAQIHASVTPDLRPAIQPTAVVHLYDEPERHLHPEAQRRVVGFLNEPRREAIALATHSHLFLGAPGWVHVHLTPTSEGTAATPFDPRRLAPHSAITRQMGLTSGELLSLVRYVLFVEGPVDEIVLSGFYGDLLADAAIALVPFHGIDEVKALAQLELLDRVVDVGMGVVADHVQVQRLGPSGKPITKEERALTDLGRRMKRRNRSLDLFGLAAEDILVYIDDEAMRAVMPRFPGWAQCRTTRRRGESIKACAERTVQARLGKHVAQQVVAAMHELGRTPSGDLPAVVAAIVAAADSATETRAEVSHR
jgi:hypothetical protein